MHTESVHRLTASCISTNSKSAIQPQTTLDDRSTLASGKPATIKNFTAPSLPFVMREVGSTVCVFINKISK